MEKLRKLEYIDEATGNTYIHLVGKDASSKDIEVATDVMKKIANAIGKEFGDQHHKTYMTYKDPNSKYASWEEVEILTEKSDYISFRNLQLELPIRLLGKKELETSHQIEKLLKEASGQSALLLGRWYTESKRRKTMSQQPAITLTNEERTILETFVHRGKANARTLTRARILLKSAEGWSTATLAAAFDVCEATVTNVRGRFAQGGLETVLHDKVQQHRRSALSGLRRLI